MADTNLPWLFLGRKIRPYALAVSLACLVITFGLLVRQDDTGDVLDGTLTGYVIGAVALTSSVLLWLGFWIKSDSLMRHGLLLSAGFFMGRWLFLSLDTSFFKTNAMLSFCWAIASAGAYLLEIVTKDPSVENSGGRV